MTIIATAVNFFVTFLQCVETGDKITFVLFVAVLAFLARYLLTLATCRQRPLPPGPKGLPFLGYLPYMNKTDTYLQLANLAKEFGPVYRVQLGVQNLIVLADLPSMRQALRQDVFSGRPITPFTDFLNDCGIVNTNGEVWKTQRRFCQEFLRQFGGHMSQQRNRKQLTDILEFEVDSLVQFLSALEPGSPIDLHSRLAACTANVMSSLLMNTRFEHNDKKFLRLLFLMDEGFRLFSLIAPVNYLPFLQFIPGVQKAHKMLIRYREEMFNFIRENVESHKRSHDPEEPPKDFVDAYLSKIKEYNSEDAKGKKFNDNQLYQAIADLLTSGMETTRVTIQWFLLYVASNPDVQSRIQDELDTVVGTRKPTIDDISKLPYTEAAILETQRLANVVAIAPPHATVQDTILSDYFIPRDSIILPLMWSVHMDSSTWKDPTKFDPTRFLNQEGRIHRPQEFIPFGIGRRHCLGSVLARLELFLISSNILHQFQLRLPSNVDPSKMTPIATTTLSPPPYKLCVYPRRTELIE